MNHFERIVKRFHQHRRNPAFFTICESVFRFVFGMFSDSFCDSFLYCLNGLSSCPARSGTPPHTRTNNIWHAAPPPPTNQQHKHHTPTHKNTPHNANTLWQHIHTPTAPTYTHTNHPRPCHPSHHRHHLPTLATFAHIPRTHTQHAPAAYRGGHMATHTRPASFCVAPGGVGTWERHIFIFLSSFLASGS